MQAIGAGFSLSSIVNLIQLRCTGAGWKHVSVEQMQTYITTYWGDCNYHRFPHCLWWYLSHRKVSCPRNSWWLPHENNLCFLSQKLALHGCLQVCNISFIGLNLTFNRWGLNARQAEYAVKKYKSHHRCGPALMMSIDIMLNWRWRFNHWHCWV